MSSKTRRCSVAARPDGCVYTDSYRLLVRKTGEAPARLYSVALTGPTVSRCILELSKASEFNLSWLADECIGDWRREPLEKRKTRLRKLLSRAKNGIQYNDHVEDDGQLLFQHACKLGLEGIVGKRIDLPYKSGRAKCWIKVRNPSSAAMLREDGSW